jgi:hypothetical protein
MPMNPSKLLQSLVTQIPARASKEGKKEWNRATKEVLCELGRKAGFEPYASLRLGKIRLHEWLLDIVWYSLETGGIQLAVESELGREEDVLFDFGKLMVVKAPLKLLLVECGKQRLIRRVEQYLQGFDHHIAGEAYLLVDFNWGHHDCYELVVKRDGKQKRGDLKFRQLDSLCGPDVPDDSNRPRRRNARR